MLAAIASCSLASSSWLEAALKPPMFATCAWLWVAYDNRRASCNYASSPTLKAGTPPWDPGCYAPLWIGCGCGSGCCIIGWAAPVRYCMARSKFPCAWLRAIIAYCWLKPMETSMDTLFANWFWLFILESLSVRRRHPVFLVATREKNKPLSLSLIIIKSQRFTSNKSRNHKK